MEEKLESLLRHDRMAGEMSMTERLMRQKNSILQRQLDINLQILDKEERSSQHQLERLMRECSEFLTELSSTWTGLDAYTQPDTRALKKKSQKKRQISVASSTGVAVQVSDCPNTDRVQKSAVCTPSSTRTRHRSGQSPRPQDKPKLTTCLEVLDDIINNHSLRRKQTKQRRIGLVMPNPVRSEEIRHTAMTYVQPEGPNRVQPFHLRPSSSYTSSQKTLNTEVQRHVRPHTAQPLRSSVYPRSPRGATQGSDYPRRPVSGSVGPRRPKSAPPKYELYGRSPAVPKRTVAGIMAEMHSRRAATRDMLGKSKQLQNYISNLAWADV